jgi:glutathione peroxidase
MNKSEFYSFKAFSIKGEEISMSEYEGKVVLIVNTASKCGFTPQYEGLEKLYTEFKDKGLLVLGFPGNQFGAQEQADNSEIEKFCTLNFNVTFPMFQKVMVNGNDAHPLFKYLKNELPGLLGRKIKWNFTKFLIDSRGRAFKRYAPMTKPESLKKDIQKLIDDIKL